MERQIPAIDILRKRPRVPGNPYAFAGTLPGRSLNNPARAWKRVLERAGILGHSSTAMTQRYAHLDDGRLRQASKHVADLMREASKPVA